jgi:hypothetical protein
MIIAKYMNKKALLIKERSSCPTIYRLHSFSKGLKIY